MVTWRGPPSSGSPLLICPRGDCPEVPLSCKVGEKTLILSFVYVTCFNRRPKGLSCPQGGAYTTSPCPRPPRDLQGFRVILSPADSPARVVSTQKALNA